MTTTTIEITTASGIEISATLSDDGERISIYQGGALAGAGRVDYSRGRILDCDARLGAEDGSETEDAYQALEAELPAEQIAHGYTLSAWLDAAETEPGDHARAQWLAGVSPEAVRVDVGALAREAAEAGDGELVALCDRASRGDKAALRACARAHAAALAMDGAS